MNQPLVSICIPNYNYERYVDECLQSALAQTYPNLEILFVDNRSTDGSLQRAQRHGGRVKVSVNEANLGMVGNFNRAAALSSGKYLVFLSTDDALEPAFVERCVEVMEAHEEVGITICERQEVDEFGALLEPTPFFYDQSCIVPSRAQLPVLMMTGIGVPCQVMVRRTVFEASGRFSERFSHSFDWYSNFRCTLHADLAYIRERLARYRVFQGNSTAAMTRNLGMSMEHYLMLLDMKALAQQHGHDRVVARYPEALERLAAMCLRYAMQMIGLGQPQVAERYLGLAQAYHPVIRHQDVFASIRAHLDGGSEAAELGQRMKALGFSTRRDQSHAPPEGYSRLFLPA